MMRLTLATILLFAGAGLAAWRLGGVLGTGVLAGFLLGAGMSGLGALHQRHVLLTRPSQSMQAMVVAFLAKLAALLIGALALRYVDACAERADWRAFMITFAATAALLLPLGAFEAAREVKRTMKPLEEAGT